MSILPTFQRLSGSGRPRILVLKAIPIFTSTDETVFSSTGVNVVDLDSVVHAGMRAMSYIVRSGKPKLQVYGRITAANVDADTITVAEWVGGTPTDGEIVTVDGYVIDLPYCQDLTETFSPDQLIHNLYRSRKASVFFGWKYSAVLDYATWIAADTIINMMNALNLSEDDEMVLIPRVDKPGNNYRVVYNGDISISRFGYGPGHKGVQFPFAGKENTVWPIPQSGYGYQFGYTYGTQL